MIAMLETWEPMLKSMYEPEEKVSIGEKNPRCNGWCCFKFSFLATFLLRCSLLTAEKGFELGHSDTITVCMLNVVYVHLFIYINSYSSFLKHFAIPKLICCWDEHFQSTLQCREMVKAWTFHTVIFFPPGRVAGTCRAKEQLDCSCGAKEQRFWKFMKSWNGSFRLTYSLHLEKHWGEFKEVSLSSSRVSCFASWETGNLKYRKHLSCTSFKRHMRWGVLARDAGNLRGMPDVGSSRSFANWRDWRGSRAVLSRARNWVPITPSTSTQCTCSLLAV